MFKNITVAVDGSDHARHALSVACDLAQQYHGQLHLIHAPEVSSTGLAVGSGAIEIAPTQEAIQAAGADVMAAAATQVRAAGLEPASETVRYGRPSAEVCGLADETGSDLIVTGRRGMSSVQGLVLGSTSQRIAHDAPCAVLTVK
ncbi:universal stress protein UspA [Jannaschia pagri]|uniref:Universal stress protein UspA n=1 Tax=Jannaschia pagri TaxID=2829797 RepID=A0ABQ4NKG1_9RHOB|nr:MULTISPECIES: universal stress protein [unclassified Jannaschia]GIT91067.1 universal stress protein UspA [Jannaschia sp. AI_61]GIT94899.1 universal stress protein UspA [Jannaschia sp. AI_62]